MARDTTLPAPPHGETKPAPPESEPRTPPTTQIVKVYHVNVLLKSRVALGYQKGELYNVVAPDPKSAVATIHALFDPDVSYVGSPTMALDNCWTTMTGS